MNLIEACKEMVEKDGEYVYNIEHSDLHYRIDSKGYIRTYSCIIGEWVTGMHVPVHRVINSGWQVHYKGAQLK